MFDEHMPEPNQLAKQFNYKIKAADLLKQPEGAITEGGLRLYVGAGPETEDGGYVDKVLAEHERLKQVAGGQNVPLAERTAKSPEPLS